MNDEIYNFEYDEELYERLSKIIDERGDETREPKTIFNTIQMLAGKYRATGWHVVDDDEDPLPVVNARRPLLHTHERPFTDDFPITLDVHGVTVDFFENEVEYILHRYDGDDLVVYEEMFDGMYDQLIDSNLVEVYKTEEYHKERYESQKARTTGEINVAMRLIEQDLPSEAKDVLEDAKRYTEFMEEEKVKMEDNNGS